MGSESLLPPRRNKRWWFLLPLLVAAAFGWLGSTPFANEPDPKIAALIEQLGHEEFSEREAASKALEAIGEPALDQLREAAAKSVDRETRYRADRIIRHVWYGSRSTGMALVPISPGEFTMGSLQGETGRAAEETQHDVKLTKPFLLGKYEVTQHEYELVMKKNPSSFTKEGTNKAALGMIVAADLQTFPVENLSWYDAIVFCNRLSELDGWGAYYDIAEAKTMDDDITSATVTIRGGRGYRLPTEAEWEYACRAGTKTPFFFGPENNGTQANVKPVMVGAGYGVAPKFRNFMRPVNVDTFPANPWGLCEMHGNVAEWCWDSFAADYYAKSPAADPSGPAEGTTHRVVRGGGWIDPEENCRSASRFWLTPREKKFHVGFRVARSE